MLVFCIVYFILYFAVTLFGVQDIDFVGNQIFSIIDVLIGQFSPILTLIGVVFLVLQKKVKEINLEKTKLHICVIFFIIIVVSLL